MFVEFQNWYEISDSLDQDDSKADDPDCSPEMSLVEVLFEIELHESHRRLVLERLKLPYQKPNGVAQHFVILIRMTSQTLIWDPGLR